MADHDHSASTDTPNEASHAVAASDAHGGGGTHSALSAGHLIGHVKDADYFDLPRFLGGQWKIPQIRASNEPIYKFHSGFKPLDDRIDPVMLKVTKFMVLEALVAVILVVVFTRLASKLRRDGTAKGMWANALEAMIVFIRDQVARPAIGGHDADRFLPFLLTAFFFILTCNLLGLVPWAGSATGAFAVTGALALLTFATVICSGMMKLGPVGFWLAQVPHMDLPPVLAVFIKPMIFVIEVLGLCIKHFILAMRLLVNMMAGHLVLAVIMAFIAASYATLAWWAVMPASLFGAVAISLLELLVAFLQAYIFTFLSALFIGMAVHPH